MTELEAQNADTLDIIKSIHRADDGYIGFVTKGKGSGNFEAVAAVDIRDLRNMLPTLMGDFIKDLYFTVNTCHSARSYNTKLSGYRWAFPERKEKHLSYLNACYVDLDVGRDPKEAKTKEQTLSVGFTIGALIELQDRGLIPAVSLYARSGRGLYAFWFLQSADDDFTPPKAWPEKVTLYKQINKALQARLAGLAPDPIAFDAARVLRVPNSIHGKTGVRVKYWAQYDESLGMPIYTLKELAGMMQIPLAYDEKIIELKKHYGRQTKALGSAPQKAGNRAALFKMRLADYFTIEQIHMGNRGHTWTQGKRRRALSYLALFLINNGYSKPDAVELIKRSAQNCLPPYPTDSTDQRPDEIFDTVKRSTVISDRELIRVFDMTPELISDNLDDILSIGVPDEEKARRKAERKTERITAKDERYGAIFKMMKGSAKDLSCRVMMKRLSRHGIEISHERARQIKKQILSNPESRAELERAWMRKAGGSNDR